MVLQGLTRQMQIALIVLYTMPNAVSNGAHLQGLGRHDAWESLALFYVKVSWWITHAQHQQRSAGGSAGEPWGSQAPSGSWQ